MYKTEEILNTPISYCYGCKNPQTHTTTVNKALDEIKTGKFKDKIAIIRSKSEIKDDVKKKLKAYIFAGEFSIRKDSSLITGSNLCVLDFDDLPFDKVDSIKEQLISDRYIIAAWTSPSAHGIKALIRFQKNEQQLLLGDAAEFHKHAYKQFSEYFETKHSQSLDPTGCNISRLCFTSYDPEIIINTCFDDFIISDFTESVKHSQAKIKTILKSMNLDESSVKNIMHSSNSLYRRKIKSIIKYLKKSDQTITGSYNNWYIVGQSIANTFSYTIGKEYYLRLCRLDGEKHSEEKSQNKLIQCYNQRNICESNPHVGFPKIEALAQEKGWYQSSKEK
jgi:hypothetical protein